MKIHSVKPTRYVIIDTSIGIFKVYDDDSLTMWSSPSNAFPGAFVWFDETDLNPVDLEKIIKLSKKHMPML